MHQHIGGSPCGLGAGSDDRWGRGLEDKEVVKMDGKWAGGLSLVGWGGGTERVTNLDGERFH